MDDQLAHLVHEYESRLAEIRHTHEILLRRKAEVLEAAAAIYPVLAAAELSMPPLVTDVDELEKWASDSERRISESELELARSQMAADSVLASLRWGIGQPATREGAGAGPEEQIMQMASHLSRASFHARMLRQRIDFYEQMLRLKMQTARQHAVGMKGIRRLEMAAAATSGCGAIMIVILTAALALLASLI